MKNFLFAVLALGLLAPALPKAHPGHEHKTMGTVTSVEKAKLAVKTTEGKDVTFEILATTDFKRGKDKGMQTDLKAGMRVVVVTAGETDLKAKEIQYSAVATIAKKQ